MPEMSGLSHSHYRISHVSVTFGGVTMAPVYSDHSNATNRWRLEHLTRVLGTLRNMLLSLAVVIAIAALLIGLVIEVFRDDLVIEPIALPKAVSDLGYSPEVAAHRIMDAIHDIQRIARTEKAKGTVLPESRSIDLAVPGVDLTLKNIARYIRSFLDLPENRVAGEFVCREWSCSRSNLKLRLRVWQDTVYMISLKELGESEEDEYFSYAAERLLLHVDPFIVASMLFETDKARARDVAIQLVRDGHRDKKWALNLIGLIEFDRENYASAAKFHEAATIIDPNFVIAHINWGVALNALRDREGAIAKYQKVIEIDPENATAYNNWGVLLDAQGDRTGAVEKYRQAIKIDPEHALAHTNLGAILRAQGKHADAIEKFKEAIKIDPGNAIAYNNWGVALKDQGAYEEAIAKYRESIEIDPEYALPYSNWGNILRAQGKHKDSIAKYKDAIAIDPDFATAYSNWGNALEALGYHTDAIEKFREAIEINPGLTAGYISWGTALGARGDYAGAVAKFQKAIEIDPDVKESYYNSGLVLAIQNKNIEAIRQFEQFLKLDSTSKLADLARIRMDQLKQKLTEKPLGE